MTAGFTITTRGFGQNDLSACLGIFDSNTPDYFAPGERAEFQQFLEAGRARFIVALDPLRTIVACGGYYFDPPIGLAGLAWGMVDRSRHNLGIGGHILELRIREIAAARIARIIRVNTSQRTTGFFAKYGFSVVDVGPDGYATGIDRVQMVREVGGVVAA